MFTLDFLPKEIVNIEMIISSAFVKKIEFHQSDPILTIIYKYLLTSSPFIITMTNHTSIDLDYMSDLQNIELFYMIEGLDIEGS